MTTSALPSGLTLRVERLVVDALHAEDASAPHGDNGVADAGCAEVLRHRVEAQPDGEVPAVVLGRKPRQPGRGTDPPPAKLS